MPDAIRITDLHKHYGTKRALDGLTLNVEEGSVFGFLGQNGAGKTTALRILLGLARATSGQVEVLGQDALRADDSLRRQIGFLPDVPGFYPWMTAPEFLRFAGSLFGLKGPVLDRRVEALLAMAGLEGVQQKVGGYSRGMKQRLGVAQAMINAPRLLLLDEPTSALDPLGRKEVLDLITELRGHTTVFFSTHILGDVERVCDSVAIIDAGRVVTEAPIADLKRRYGSANRWHIEVSEQGQRFAELLSREPWVEQIRPAEHGITVSAKDATSAGVRIPALVGELGVGLTRYEPVDVSLEDVFIDLVGKGQAA